MRLYFGTRPAWRAVRKKDWKLVSPDYWKDYKPWRSEDEALTDKELPEDTDALWELYDMKQDRTETKNLADDYPEQVASMIKKYRDWEQRVIGP